MKSAISLLYCWVFCKVAQMLSGMAALNGGLGATGLTNGTAGTMDALTQAYSGIQQYAAAALPTLYSQSLLQQQGAAGSQKEGTWARPAARALLPETRRGRRPGGRGSSLSALRGDFFLFFFFPFKKLNRSLNPVLFRLLSCYLRSSPAVTGSSCPQKPGGTPSPEWAGTTCPSP